MNSQYTFMATLMQAEGDKVILSVLAVDAGRELSPDDSGYSHRVGYEPIAASLERFKAYVADVKSTVFDAATHGGCWIREPDETLVDFVGRFLSCNAFSVKPIIVTDCVPKDFDPSVN